MVFNCNDDGLNNYLREKALNDYNQKLNTTQLILNDDTSEILGYFTLRNTALLYTIDSKPEIKTLYRGLPAIEITYLAVQVEFQHQGIGSKILEIIIGNAIQSAKEFSATKYIVLKSLAKCTRFYEANQFKNLTPFMELPFEPNLAEVKEMYLNLDGYNS